TPLKFVEPFIVANIGPDNIELKTGVPIRYAQFFKTERPDRPKPVDNVGFDHLTDTLFGATYDSGVLAYFRDVRDLRAEVEKLRHNVSDVEKTIERVRSVTDNVVVFGVFLVSATILGVVLAALTNLIESAPARMSHFRQDWIAALATI